MFQFLGRNSGRSDASAPLFRRIVLLWFQFLGRNSGRSDYAVCSRSDPIIRFQFLGRNSGRSDQIEDYWDDLPDLVSIPRSEFWSFGRRGYARSAREHREFQFLGRNSGRSDGTPPQSAVR